MKGSQSMFLSHTDVSYVFASINNAVISILAYEALSGFFSPHIFGNGITKSKYMNPQFSF